MERIPVWLVAVLVAAAFACGDEPSGGSSGGEGGSGGAEGRDPNCIEIWPASQERREWCRPEGWGPYVCFRVETGDCSQDHPEATQPVICYEFEGGFGTPGAGYFRTCWRPTTCRDSAVDNPACCKTESC